MKQSKDLRFAETSISLQNFHEERSKNKRTLLKELNWNNYEKIRIVGKGAFGTAILYRKKSDGLLVVLKEINMNALTASERQLAINEVKVLSILNHPNIISYYDSFECNGDLYIEMEYADAGTLADFLAQLSTPLQEHEILLIFRQIVAAILYLHDNNILHRDIKTANIFLNKEGYIKVGDFGISKMLTSRNDANTCVGTPYYISPEICEGKFYNQKSDVWALGCVLYEMACLQKTFEGSNLPVLINKIIKGQFAPVKRNFSSDFRNLITELLQKNPELRPSAFDVMEDVTRILNKLQLDRYRIWSQHNELPTCVSSEPILAMGHNKSSMHCPRSVVYEVKIKEPHISLSTLPLPRKQRIKQLSKSSTHFIALSYNFTVYTWGCGMYGQLGLGEEVNSIEKPTCVESIRNRNIVSVCAGEGFSVFVSKNGLVMTCGDNSNGCLGRCDPRPCFIPKLVDTLLSIDVASIDCSAHHVAAVTGDGKAYAWGCNIDGRLGTGQKDILVDTPTPVMMDEDVIIKSVFCGPDATAFIDDNGCVWMCGNNDNNKLGLNEKLKFRMNKIAYKEVPTKLKWIKQRVHSVSLGKNHSAILIDGGKVITMGSNTDGQLGLGHVRHVYKPQLVTQLSQQTIIRVQTGKCFTLASNFENILYFWGVRSYNKSSQSHEKSRVDHELSCEPIKIGECNQSLMNVVEYIGPDFPIVQISDPKVIINKLHDLDLLNSSDATMNRDVILKPQAIVSIYASPVHLNHGEIIGLANVYCFDDDKIYIIIDTTLAIQDSNRVELRLQQTSISDLPNKQSVKNELQSIVFETNESILSENIPEWIRQEMNDDIEIRPLNKSESLPNLLISRQDSALEQCVHCREEDIIAMKEQLKECHKTIANLRLQNRELNEQIQKIKKQKYNNNWVCKKLQCCIVQ